MSLKRGGIYIANFNPSKGLEPGKVRPCMVVQNDLLNEISHPSTTVIPLTTNLIDDAAPLRFRITARDALQSDSDAMIDQMSTIDNKRFNNELLTILTAKECIEIEEYLKIVLCLDN